MAVKLKRYKTPGESGIQFRLIKVTARNLQNVVAWLSDQKDVKDVQVVERGARLDKRQKAATYIRVHIEGTGIRVAHIGDFVGQGLVGTTRWSKIFKADRFAEHNLELVK